MREVNNKGFIKILVSTFMGISTYDVIVFDPVLP